MKKIEIILCDDHQIVRDGISALLVSAKNIEIIAKVTDGKELLEKLPSLKPDIVLLDITLPGISGIDLAEIITKDYPRVKIIMLTMITDLEIIFSALNAGAKGYLSKDVTKEEILEAIDTVLRGDDYFSAKVSKTLIGSYLSRTQNVQDFQKKNKVTLTERETEILKLFVQGISNQEIASQLFISIRTVETHKANMMKKLEFKSVVDLVKYAIKNNIIEM